MDGFSISKILIGLRNPQLYLKKLKAENTNLEFKNNVTNVEENIIKTTDAEMPEEVVIKTPENSENINKTQQIKEQTQANQVKAMNRSVYIKELLGLPQTLKDLMEQLLPNKQSSNVELNQNLPMNQVAPLVNSLIVKNISNHIMENKEMLSMLFDENSPELLLPMVNTEYDIAQNLQTLVYNSPEKDIVTLLFSGMLTFSVISNTIKKNSKQAITNLIAAMSASKKGASPDEIRETMSVINSCVALASSDNPTQIIKSLMLLYLPWLPLSEGVDFDLDIEPPDGENKLNDSRLTVLIQTRNYGNIKGVFTLTTKNSVDIYIQCPEEFPKLTLEKSLVDESSTLSTSVSIDVESVGNTIPLLAMKQEVKVNLSATNEMNPYLLLLTHAFIRNTIFIDSNTVLKTA